MFHNNLDPNNKFSSSLKCRSFRSKDVRENYILQVRDLWGVNRLQKCTLRLISDRFRCNRILI